jgi:hypothetical protein
MIETEQVYADADAGRDHMGRRRATSVAHAFSMDWPWVLAALLILVFVVAAMAGYFRI